MPPKFAGSLGERSREQVKTSCTCLNISPISKSLWRVNGRALHARDVRFPPSEYRFDKPERPVILPLFFSPNLERDYYRVPRSEVLRLFSEFSLGRLSLHSPSLVVAKYIR